MTVARGPYIKDGFFTFGIDRRADAWYSIDLIDYLAEKGTTLASLDTVSVVGVDQSAAAKITGTVLWAKLATPDTAAGAENSCTFHFTLANGDTDVATIKFEVETH